MPVNIQGIISMNNPRYIQGMPITGFFVHGFLPDSMLLLLIVLVIKDKAGSINPKTATDQLH